MKERFNIDHKFTFILISLIAFALLSHFVSGCTPPTKLQYSTKEVKEAKIILATVIDIDTTVRFDRWEARVWWQDSDKTYWLVYTELPCPYWIGYRMILLTKR